MYRITIALFVASISFVAPASSFSLSFLTAEAEVKQDRQRQLSTIK